MLRGKNQSRTPKRWAWALATSVLTVALLAFCFSPGPVRAAAPKRINLATMTEPSGEYEIGFCARPSPGPQGWPGHAFVSFSHANASGHDFTAIGHTVAAGTPPLAAGWSLFGNPVTGRLKEENYTSIFQDCLLVKVNKQDYDRAYSLTQSPLGIMGITRGNEIVFQAYKLGTEDCVTSMIDVAKTLQARGLHVPTRTAVERPLDYLKRFIAAN